MTRVLYFVRSRVPASLHVIDGPRRDAGSERAQIHEVNYMGRPRWERIEWHSDDRFTLDGVNFWLTTTQYDVPSTPECFVFLKNRAFLRAFEPLFEKVKPERLLEVGIFHGGGTAFYDLLLRPEKLVCIDLVPDAPMLRHYMRAHAASPITIYCGVDQSDRAQTHDILEREFPARDLDLIVDDASHMYYPTRTSFEIAFPYLRTGGLYVIEDWCWSHWAGQWQDPATPVIPGPALSNLIFELVMVEGTNPDIISQVYVDPFYVAIERGPRQLSQPLHLEDVYLTRGNKLSLL